MTNRKIGCSNSKAKRALLSGSLALILLGGAAAPRSIIAQSPLGQAAETTHFPHAQFKIPFNVDARGTQPTQVQLWVSTDQGASWQMQGSATSGQKHFEFRAAAEGLYLFSVQTLDEEGKAFPSPHPPLRIMIDTTKPQVALRADVNASGQVVVDVRINDEHLKTDSVRLRYRTDQETGWQETAVTNLVAAGQIYEGQVTLDLKNCREIGFVVTVADEAGNVGESSSQFSMPRTAAAFQDIKLASQRNGSEGASAQSGIAPTPGAIAWPTSPVAQPQPGNQPQHPSLAQKPFGASGPPAVISPRPAMGQQPSTLRAPAFPPSQTAGSQPGGWSVSGQLAGSAGGLSLNAPQGSPIAGTSTVTPSVTQEPSASAPYPTALVMPGAEELPAPKPIEGSAPATAAIRTELVDKQATPPDSPDSAAPANTPPRGSNALDTIDTERAPTSQAFHCNSRSFSLDYSLNSAAGSALADVELWGTEDGGSTWQKWGSDPDRQSPFDVQVANDGLFGFRMVIVSHNGKVSNRPKNGDSGDAWIHVDTAQPIAKITRAVYGDGHEAGMLVIDYTCDDDNLHDRPISLSYSEAQSGPWVTIATGLKNTGIYLWKVDANLPENIFVRLESVDKAGNMAMHVLDLPINVQGLMPRGRIQGFRPINNPE